MSQTANSKSISIFVFQKFKIKQQTHPKSTKKKSGGYLLTKASLWQHYNNYILPHTSLVKGYYHIA